MNRSLHSMTLVASLTFGATSCFTGEDALGLPCNQKGDCGQDQACMAGYCSTVDAGPCGDGRLNKGEECDDGNTVDDDACTAACKFATCGDGILQVGVEACDDGAANGAAGSCSETCTLNTCGDGVINGADACDDGPGNGADKACTPECKANVCGDGFALPTEGCDDGEENGADKACTPECLANVCGDGYAGPGESCDSPDRSVCTMECLEVIFLDRMEAGEGAWSHEVADEPPIACDTPSFCIKDLWSISANVPAINTHPDGEKSTRAWYSGDLFQVQGPASVRLISPEIDLTDAKAPITLGFTHIFHFLQYPDKRPWNVDGAIVEVSTDGGDFIQIDLPGYNGPITDDGMCPVDNPLLGSQAFLDEITSWASESANLDAFAGHKIRLGFRLSTDCSISKPLDPLNWKMNVGDDRIEWFIDNVRVIGNTAAN